MKKVLIITYYWPPAGGPGVQRVVRFSKWLPQFGWQPIVLTVKNPMSPVEDQSLLDDILRDFEIHKTSAIEPFALYNIFMGKKSQDKIPKDVIQKKERDSYKDKLSRIIRANIFIPDARIGWIPWMIKEGTRIIKKNKIEVIFSTSPPHSLQLGAKYLANKFSVKWIADLRDPWSNAYWENDLKRIQVLSNLNKNFEQNVLIRADKIVTPSKGYISSNLNDIKNKVIPIYTGFETLTRGKTKTDRFEILFLGNLSKAQSPEPIFLALDQLPTEIKTHIHLHFLGRVFEDHQKIFNNYPEIKIIKSNFLPYHEAMELSRSSSILLFIIHDTSYSKDYLPVKIFDYLSLRKPILALGSKNSKIEEILEETKSGEVIDKSDILNIVNFIKHKYEAWQTNKYILLPENPKLENYQTEYNVKKLVTLFED